MRTLRDLFNSYATPPTQEELKLLEKLDQKTPPISTDGIETGTERR